MTRAEQIEKAANKYVKDIVTPLPASLAVAFVKGAEWADAHPMEVVEDAEEDEKIPTKRPLRGDIIRITHIGERAMRRSKLKEGDMCKVVSSWEYKRNNDIVIFVRVRYPDGKAKSNPIRSSTYDWEIIDKQEEEKQ